MALKANLKGAKSARDSFGPLYNKIVAGKFGDTAATAAAASSRAKGSPLKRKGVDDDDDEDGVASPLKMTKATPRKGKGKAKGGKKEEKAEEDSNGVEKADDDDDNIVVVKAEVLDGD
jgi:hypothetical protein